MSSYGPLLHTKVALPRIPQLCQLKDSTASHPLKISIAVVKFCVVFTIIGVTWMSRVTQFDERQYDIKSITTSSTGQGIISEREVCKNDGVHELQQQHTMTIE